MIPHPSSSIKKQPITHLWSRFTTARHEDEWRARLHFAGPEALVIKLFPASERVQLQLYTSKAIAHRLQKNFGGNVRPFNPATWTLPTQKRRLPLRIARTLRVHNDRASFLDDQKKSSPQKSRALLIPAGMAFGTGDHATTHGCLRLLSHVAVEFQTHPWSLLDLGTGSGVLALAGELLGATKILGVDFDKTCVRISQENAVLNNLSHARFRHADILKWKIPGTWTVVTANIYSSVLTASASNIVDAIAPAGSLILSGILAVERPDIETVFTQLGMKKKAVITRGKWSALHFSR